MALDYRIDTACRLVYVRISGTLTDAEIFGYQRDVWSRPEVQGFDELVDMRAVEAIALPSPDRVKDLARESSSQDPAASSAKLAIVASGDLSYGLGRMYESYRGLAPGSTKAVSVFRALADACVWLGIDPQGTVLEGALAGVPAEGSEGP